MAIIMNMLQFVIKLYNGAVTSIAVISAGYYVAKTVD